MKKRLQITLIISLTISTFVFGFLWYAEKNNDDLRLLAQSGAKDTYTSFVEYRESGDESDYWNGVASFRAFEQAYYLLTENTNKDVNYIFCNEVYGALLLSPEKSREHIADIIATMEILAEDVESENGYLKMSALRNILK